VAARGGRGALRAAPNAGRVDRGRVVVARAWKRREGDDRDEKPVV